MPKAYAYIRCSHQDSAESGLGMEAQEENCRRYFHLLESKFPGLEWGGLIVDSSKSAYKKPLVAREGGKKLNLQLQRGDHVLFARLDRAFRLVRDTYNMVELWTHRGVTIHFVDIQLDLSSAIGKFFMGMMAVIAQWQSDYISERTKEGLAKAAKNRGVHCSTTRVGHTRIRSADGKVIEIRDHRKQVACRYICALHSAGFKENEISDRLERLLAKRDDRKYQTARAFREWPPSRVSFIYRKDRKGTFWNRRQAKIQAFREKQKRRKKETTVKTNGQG